MFKKIADVFSQSTFTVKNNCEGDTQPQSKGYKVPLNTLRCTLFRVYSSWDLNMFSNYISIFSIG